MEKTLILLKPDCIQRRLVGAIIQRLEAKGLRLAAMKFVHVRRDLAAKHYAEHQGKPFYEAVLGFLTSGPTVAMAWEGLQAVAVVRTLMGPTDGTKAPPGTIRGDYAITVQNNLIHGSDSVASAEREIALWFKPEEFVSYQSVDAGWVSGA